MRFKRLVSGIAALTVAMGTFATMTITASAAIVQKYEYTLNYHLEEQSGQALWSDTKQDQSGWPSFKSNEIIKHDGKNYVYVSETHTYEDPDVKPAGDGFELSYKGTYNVIVRNANTYTFAIQKVLGSANAEPFEYNDNGFSAGSYSYIEGEDVPANQDIEIALPRFEVGDDGNVYELKLLSPNANDTKLGTSHQSNTFKLKFNPNTFASKTTGSADVLLNYAPYSHKDLPNNAVFDRQIGIKDEGSTSDDTASNAQKGGTEVTIERLAKNKKYYFVVTHNGNLDKDGSGIAPAYLGSGWKDEVLEKVTTTGGKATIKVTSGNIDTVLVYSTEAEKFNLSITANGVDPAPELATAAPKTITKGDPDTKDVKYSYPRYVQGTDGKLYMADSIYVNGEHENVNDTYTKTIKDDDLKNYTGTSYNVRHGYRRYDYPGVDGEFVALKEFDDESHTDEVSASNGSYTENGTYTITTPGEHTLVVRHKGLVTVSGTGVSEDNVTLSGDDASWKEDTVKVRINSSDTVNEQISFSGSVDSVLDYNKTIASEIRFHVLDRKDFTDSKARPGGNDDKPYTAYVYQADILQGTDGQSYTIAVKAKNGQNQVDSENVKFENVVEGFPEGTGTPLISGASSIKFGIIVPRDYTEVTPYAPEVQVD